ncbi:hypothetical protein TrVE_jg10722 [Triparma verrucosa]|nr:hypothetical protein TrVE_jg10722 [Triparma verrucosa]
MSIRPTVVETRIFKEVIAASGEGASKPRLSASLVSRILGCLASDLKANLKSGKTYTIPKIGTFKYNVLRDEIAFKPSKGLTEDLGGGEVGGGDSFEYR